MDTKKCEYCGKEFVPKNYAKKARFCSPECYHKWRRKRVKVKCSNCGKEIFRRPSQLKGHKYTFCSVKCQEEYFIGKNSPRWRRKTVSCAYCGKKILLPPSLIRNTNFCSPECRYKYQSEHMRGENHPQWRGGKVKTYCAWCGAEIERLPSALKEHNFCSRKCFNRWVAKVSGQRISKPEQIFGEICMKYNLPFVYVGDSSFFIDNLNPDFVDISRKIAIEIFGEHWHAPLLNPHIRPTMELNTRRDIFKKNGWKLLVIWQLDLEREDAEEYVLGYLKKEKVISSDVRVVNPNPHFDREKKRKVIKVRCDNCGKEFEREAKDIRRVNHHFCSQQCFFEFRSKNATIEVSCFTCGKKIKIKKSYAKACKRFFCSRACRQKWRKEFYSGANNPNWKQLEVECAYCGKKISLPPSKIALAKNNFCSCECARKYYGELRKRNNKKLKIKCDNCGTEIERYPSQLGEHNFCSISCYHNWKKRSNDKVEVKENNVLPKES